MGENANFLIKKILQKIPIPKSFSGWVISIMGFFILTAAYFYFYITGQINIASIFLAIPSYFAIFLIYAHWTD